MEHLHPLESYINEMKRVMKPGGVLAGAIPCEGGLAWGIGRYLTSRRYLKANSQIDPDKIICWEHRNFADSIMNQLTRSFKRVCVNYWPLSVPLIDTNLIISFIYMK